MSLPQTQELADLINVRQEPEFSINIKPGRNTQPKNNSIPHKYDLIPSDEVDATVDSELYKNTKGVLFLTATKVCLKPNDIISAESTTYTDLGGYEIPAVKLVISEDIADKFYDDTEWEHQLYVSVDGIIKYTSYTIAHNGNNLTLVKGFTEETAEEFTNFLNNK